MHIWKKRIQLNPYLEKQIEQKLYLINTDFYCLYVWFKLMVNQPPPPGETSGFTWN